MEQSDINKLLALRSAWDKFKSVKGEKSASDFDSYYEIIWTHSIADHTQIIKFNDEMIMELLVEYRTIHWECDLCEGYKGIPPCTLLYGNRSCATTRNALPRKTLDKGHDFYLILFLGIKDYARKLQYYKENNVPYEKQLEEWNATHPVSSIVGDRLYTVCPPGHGYYHDYKITDEDLPFNLFWIP
jgi:hypothetical protein